MSILPDFFGGGGGEDDEVEEEVSNAIRELEEQVADAERKERRRKIMSGEDLDLTEEDVDLSFEVSDNQLNVARSAVEDEMRRALQDLERERRKIKASEVSGEGREVLKLCEDLEEANEELVELVVEMFEVKNGISGGTSLRDIAEVHREAESLVRSGIEEYRTLEARAENHPELRNYVLTALNVFRNLVKTFSALDQDAQQEYGRYLDWIGKNGEPDLRKLLPAE